jgi:transcription antitermination factor NusG
MTGQDRVRLAENLRAAAVRDAISPKGWQLVYTVARHENTVAAQLQARGVEFYLPLYEVTHCWGRRSVKLQLSLFPSYVFVRLTALNRRNVVTTPGVVSVVSFQGQPALVPEEQITAVQNALRFRRAHPCSYLANGNRVLITTGPLRGIVGVIDRIKNLRVIVTVDSIASSIAIDVDAADIELAA